MCEPSDLDSDKRLFARRAVGEVITFLDQLRGQPPAQAKQPLHDIGALAFESLCAVGARVSPGVVLELREEQLCAQRATSEGSIDLGVVMELDAPDRIAFNMFDGRHTLGQVAAAMAAAQSWEPEVARERVRALFVRLVRQGVCVPAPVEG